MAKSLFLFDLLAVLEIAQDQYRMLQKMKFQYSYVQPIRLRLHLSSGQTMVSARLRRAKVGRKLAKEILQNQLHNLEKGFFQDPENVDGELKQRYERFAPKTG